ncbi:hypothetical protein R2F61_09105 [Mollicutes bacterium LVI A0078]|nr:hypothetical protein RZE84_08880 [Mollicutes bacterium LVI A0075]WOO90857.1 hypothetical protein R2F61_09105 [Mollicutes bacterium LVI A0078]
MNNELTQIITDLESKLNCLSSNQEQTDEVLYNVQNLQKQLLSASLLNKPNLESSLKEQLKVAEAEMYSHYNRNENLELAYLYQYIKERYE